MSKPESSIVALASDVKQQHRDQIASAAREVMHDQGIVDGFINQIASAVEKMPEYQNVEKLAEELAAAREHLNMVISRNAGINELKEALAKARRDLRDSKGTLSGLLVHYTADHKEKSLIVNSEHRLIEISAKLGKPLDVQEVLPL